MALISYIEWRKGKNPRLAKQGFVGGNPRYSRKGIHGDATSLSRTGTRPEDKLAVRKEIDKGLEDREKDQE